MAFGTCLVVISSIQIVIFDRVFEKMCARCLLRCVTFQTALIVRKSLVLAIWDRLHTSKLLSVWIISSQENCQPLTVLSGLFVRIFFAAIGLLPENKEGNVLIYLWQQYFIYLLVRIFTYVTFMSLLKTQEMSYNLLEVTCPGKSIFSWKVHEIQKKRYDTNTVG